MLAGNSISDQSNKREEPVFPRDQPRTKHKTKNSFPTPCHHTASLQQPADPTLNKLY